MQAIIIPHVQIGHKKGRTLALRGDTLESYGWSSLINLSLYSDLKSNTTGRRWRPKQGWIYKNGWLRRIFLDNERILDLFTVWGQDSSMKATWNEHGVRAGLRLEARREEGISNDDGEQVTGGPQERVQESGEQPSQWSWQHQPVQSCCPNLWPSFFFRSAVRGPRLDFGCVLQRSSTSAPRMGHVRVHDGVHLLPPLPGRVPLWRGDSDQCQLELPGKEFLSLSQENVGSL